MYPSAIGFHSRPFKMPGFHNQGYKSKLSPSQNAILLGMVLDSVTMKAVLFSKVSRSISALPNTFHIRLTVCVNPACLEFANSNSKPRHRYVPKKLSTLFVIGYR